METIRTRNFYNNNPTLVAFWQVLAAEEEHFRRTKELKAFRVLEDGRYFLR
jgi:hypothetical protein